jgi:antitoxin component YwqK of YwqJK toxin-antitoxin module
MSMTILHDAYVALLSGLTTKTNNEIHWEDENGAPITVELISVAECKYVIRRYYNSGQIRKEVNYHQDLRHGKDNGWYKSGQKKWEDNYYQGQQHGKNIGWYDGGQKCYEIDYHQGQRHGKYIEWRKNGRKWWEEEYEHGKPIRRIL